MKTRLLCIIVFSVACSATDGAFGCPDAPPQEGSACDSKTFPPDDVCFAPSGSTYHCSAAGKWTYGSEDGG